MFKVSDIIHTAPEEFSTPLQKEVYATFSKLGIPFERVDTDPGLTMEDCQWIDEKIGCRIVKTLFLCNRQQTEFYLYVTSDDKPFITKEFCGKLGIPRVSFAGADNLKKLTGVEVGATTILSSVLHEAAAIHLVMDKEIAESEVFACTDGTATCFVKIKTEDLIGKYIPSTGHNLLIISNES
ncbi:MAG: prolyl-tRNA synthetase associated domain-containing protein [Bacteroidales bacterium]|nr:prolyl-tRNA synthetase associated domain-containing protein [Bacteroidales bacterium]